MKYVGQNVEDELRSRRDSAAVQAEEPVEGQAPVRVFTLCKFFYTR